MHTKVLSITLPTTLFCLGIGVIFFKFAHCPVNIGVSSETVGQIWTN